MRSAGRLYVLSAAIALVVMADRVGWINWVRLGEVTGVMLVALVALAGFLVVVGVMLSVPLLLGMAVWACLGPGPNEAVRRPE